MVTRPPHEALADLHAYIVPITPKMLRESLCLAQGTVLRSTEYHEPTRRAVAHHLQLLIDEIDRMRPLGPDGKHDHRHTSTCGCRP